MRELAIKEVSQISAGNILTEMKGITSNGIGGESQTLAVGSLCAGLVVGGLLPGKISMLMGMAGFATWAVYDATGQYIWNYLGFGGATEDTATSDG